MLAAGLLFQLSASLYADNWSDAAQAFGGAEAVYNNRGSLAWSTALAIAKQLGSTPEAMSIALYQANGNPNVLKSKFAGAMSQDVVESALQNMLSVRSPQTPVNSVPVTSAPVTTTPVVTAPVEPTITTADIQAAMVAQQKADAALAASNSQALSNLVTSNATGASLYNSYIDLILNALMQALNSIVDPAVQQQVIGYTQNKLANMKASASSVSNSSRVIGRMSSQKKTVKKNKHSRSHVAR